MSSTHENHGPAEPPRLSYTALGRREEEKATEDDVTTEKTAERYLNIVFTVLTWCILVVVLLVWGSVGLIFWIPLLLRTMLRFCVSLVEAMFAGQKPVRAARYLRDAVSFYRRGFVVAVEVVLKEEIASEERAPRTESRLLFEFFWAVFVWYFIALAMGWIETSPLDGLNWLLSIPWAEHVRGWVAAIGWA